MTRALLLTNNKDTSLKEGYEPPKIYKSWVDNGGTEVNGNYSYQQNVNGNSLY